MQSCGGLPGSESSKQARGHGDDGWLSQLCELTTLRHCTNVVAQTQED